jgi:hypothetical protein
MGVIFHGIDIAIYGFEDLLQAKFKRMIWASQTNDRDCFLGVMLPAVLDSPLEVRSGITSLQQQNSKPLQHPSRVLGENSLTINVEKPTFVFCLTPTNPNASFMAAMCEQSNHFAINVFQCILFYALRDTR